MAARDAETTRGGRSANGSADHPRRRTPGCGRHRTGRGLIRRGSQPFVSWLGQPSAGRRRFAAAADAASASASTATATATAERQDRLVATPQKADHIREHSANAGRYRATRGRGQRSIVVPDPQLAHGDTATLSRLAGHQCSLVGRLCGGSAKEAQECLGRRGVHVEELRGQRGRHCRSVHADLVATETERRLEQCQVERVLVRSDTPAR